jgi:hypothetical protein
MTTTLIRVPDQFSPGAGAVATAATPTCCCCCCCVTSLVVTSAVLAEGLNADLRQAERRSPAAVILIALGPLIAVVPLLVMVVGSSSWLSRLFSYQLGSAELVAVLVAGLWTLAIPVASGARRPFAGLLRLAVGVVLWITEFILAAFTLMTVELIGLVLIPVIIINLRQFYRRANRR